MERRLFPVATFLLAVAVWCGAASLALAAQAPGRPAPQNVPPRDARPAAQTGTAAIRGRVLAGDTKKPLRRARIIVSAPELGPQGRTVGTDADGNYEVLDLPAARYRIEVRRSGYLNLLYGQTRPLEQGKPLQAAAGESVDHVDFLMPRMSVISGRITDELGDPVEGVMVVALRSRYWDGRRQLVPTGNGIAVSDDAGQYRVLGLAPGTYYVMATTRETWTVNEGGVGRVMGYAPTYAPTSTVPDGARRVQVALGQEAATIDVMLVPGRAASISGTAVDSHGRPFDTVSLREEIRGENFARFGGNNSTTVAADGTFTLKNVPPGQYKLVATTGRETAHPEAAIVPVSIDSVDVTGIALVGSEGGSITGRVRTDIGEVPRIPRLRVTMGLPLTGQPDPTLLGTFRNPGSSEVVATDGTFNIIGVFGSAPLRVILPDEWMVKTIVHNGREIVDAPIELRSGETLSDVEIIVTNQVSTLSGSVANDKGQPIGDATVLVFSDDAGKWAGDSRSVRAVRPDQQGLFQIKGLPAGGYLAIAVDYVEEGTWNDPEYLEELRSSAQKIAIGDASQSSVPLKLRAAR